MDALNRVSLIQVSGRVIDLRDKTILLAPLAAEARKVHIGWRRNRQLQAAMADVQQLQDDIESRCNAPFWTSVAHGTLKRGWKNPLLELRREVEKAVPLAWEHIEAKAAGRRPKTSLELGISKAFVPAIRKADSLLADAYAVS